MAPSLFPSKENGATKPVKVGALPEDKETARTVAPTAPMGQKAETVEFITFDDPPPLDDAIPRRSPHEIFKVIKDLLTKRFNDVERMFYEIDEMNSMRLSQEQMYQLFKRYEPLLGCPY